MQKGRDEISQYEGLYAIKMPGKILASRLATNSHLKTVSMSFRPVGTTAIIASHDNINGAELYMIEPSGQCYQYYGCSSGRGKQICRNELEKLNFRE